MEASSSTLPVLLQQQESASCDKRFKAQLKKLAKKNTSEAKRRIFISYARPLPEEQREFSQLETKFKEQGTVEFAKKLADHLSLLEFDVLLADNNLGLGVHPNSAMEKAVNGADHVLLLVTRTYLFKRKERSSSGVNTELSYIDEKIERMGGASVAGKQRFVLPFVFVDKIPAGFPLIDGHGGFAPTFLSKVGYQEALLDLATKLFNNNSSSVLAGREGFFSPAVTELQKVEKQKVGAQERLASLMTQIREHKSRLIQVFQKKCLGVEDRFSCVINALAAIDALVFNAKANPNPSLPISLLLLSLLAVGGVILAKPIEDMNLSMCCYIMGVVLCQKADHPFSVEDLEKNLSTIVKEKHTSFNSQKMEQLIQKCEQAYKIFLENKKEILNGLNKKSAKAEVAEAYQDLLIAHWYHEEAILQRDQIKGLQVRVNTIQDKANREKSHEESASKKLKR